MDIGFIAHLSRWDEEQTIQHTFVPAHKENI
jgi:hypothetical protein